MKLIQALHHLRQHLGELPCQEQKVAGSREKVGFYWIFSETIMPSVFCWSTFLDLAVGLFFFGHHFLGDSQLNGACDSMIPSMIIDDRGFGTAVRDPMMFDEALKSYGSFAFTPLFFRFGVGGYVCIYCK